MANLTPVDPTSTSYSPMQEEGEMDLVATWLVFDLPRTIAGAIAGIFAGAVAWVFAGLLAVAGGYEFWFPFKIPAVVLMGREAMTLGLTPSVFVGLALHSVICATLGMVYSHFVKSNRWAPLLAAGFMWGTFSWIFINNLFIRSFQAIRELNLSNGAAFWVLLVLGFSLASIKIFDRIICGRARY